MGVYETTHCNEGEEPSTMAEGIFTDSGMRPPHDSSPRANTNESDCPDDGRVWSKVVVDEGGDGDRLMVVKF